MFLFPALLLSSVPKKKKRNILRYCVVPLRLLTLVAGPWTKGRLIDGQSQSWALPRALKISTCSDVQPKTHYQTFLGHAAIRTRPESHPPTMRRAAMFCSGCSAASAQLPSRVIVTWKPQGQGLATAHLP
jgi:hypothetical protein